MISAIGSSLSLRLTPSTAASQSTDVLTAFGPAFFLQTFDNRRTASAAAYDSSGRLIDPTVDSKSAQDRQKAIERIAGFLKAGNTASARTEAESLLKKNPDDAVAMAYVGRTFLVDGDYRKAEQFYLRAASRSSDPQIQTDLKNTQILERGEASATADMKRLLTQPASARQGLQLATYLLSQHPENLDARLGLVRYYEKSGQLGLAGGELLEAVKATPPARRDELVSYLEGFASRHDSDKGAHDLLAQAYAADGRLDAADAEFQRALSLAKDDFKFGRQVKQDQAGIYDQRASDAVAAGRTKDAEQAYRKALELSPNDERRGRLSDLEYKTGLDWMRRGSLKFAQRAFDAAQAALPIVDNKNRKDDLNNAYVSLVARFTSAGDLKGVVSARQGSYNLKPSDETRKTALATAHDAYGLDLYGRQDYSNAVLAFRKALKLYPNNATYAQHLANALGHL